MERIVQAQLESGPVIQLPQVTPKTPIKSPMRHLSKLKSTLHQFVRDWSEEVHLPRNVFAYRCPFGWLTSVGLCDAGKERARYVLRAYCQGAAARASSQTIEPVSRTIRSTALRCSHHLGTMIGTLSACWCPVQGLDVWLSRSRPRATLCKAMSSRIKCYLPATLSSTGKIDLSLNCKLEDS